MPFHRFLFVSAAAFCVLAHAFFPTGRAFAQGGGTGAVAGTVNDAHEGHALPGASVLIEGTSLGAATDETGRFQIDGIPEGARTVRVSMVGFAPAETSVVIVAGATLEIAFALEESHAEVAEVVVTGTRTVRSVADVPVRVEVIPGEEVEEKLLMTPGSVAMLLNESTGMRVQTTSGASNTANLRIQGLSGRYTQILTDGVPAYGGLSAGFSITQIPPLNLRQVEVIKGAVSTLYGPDAIAGVVNFLTKRPPEEGAEFSGLLNATTAEGFDAAAYGAERKSERFAYSVFASGNTQEPYYADGGEIADIAGYDRVTVSPKAHLAFSESAEATVGLGFMTERRRGGWARGVWPDALLNPYTEIVDTRRWDAVTGVGLRFDSVRTAGVKLAAMQMRRDASYDGSPFNAIQRAVYADAQLETPIARHHTLLLGAAFTLEELDDRTPGIGPDRSYTYRTPGLFAQTEWRLSGAWSALAGVRTDFQSAHGLFVTPRASVKFSPDGHLTMRAGGGSGFKSPTIFVEEAEEVGFRNVRPISGLEPERASSASFDVNWRAPVPEGFTFDVNAAFYLSRITRSLVADEESLAAGGVIEFRNATGPVLARGGEMAIKTGYGDFKLYLGYTYVYATRDDAGSTREIALNPRHSAGLVLFYEAHESGMKIGLETYWTGRQRLERNPYRSIAPDYFVTGLVAEKAFGPLRLFVNFENIFDTRQTRWDPTSRRDTSTGRLHLVPVYAPLEGRVINGGVRLVL